MKSPSFALSIGLVILSLSFAVTAIGSVTVIVTTVQSLVFTSNVPDIQVTQ
jgi:hypothetical protein